VFRSHVLALGGANLFAGAGFMIIGLAELGAPFSVTTGLHILSVASLGLAVLGVFIIAGLRHTGRSLDLPWQAHAALILMTCAGLVRALSETGLAGFLMGQHYALSSLLWSAAFLVWLIGFLPLFRHPLNLNHSNSDEAGGCG
jgi:uncharacterized protein involved in response to NO